MTRIGHGITERCPESLVEVNPLDAAQIGVREGDFITVTSRRGAVRARAKLTDRSPAGTVFMNFHFREVAVNLLTNPALDPVAKIPEYKVCAVKIKAA